MSSALHMLLVMLSIHVGKSSNSRSQMFLRMSQCSEENTCVGVSFYKATGPKACIFIKKETPTQVFGCEYYKIFKNSFFKERLFIVVIDIRYFKVIFYYCKIRPRNRKSFTIDRSKCFFLNQDFNSSSMIFFSI